MIFFISFRKIIQLIRSISKSEKLFPNRSFWATTVSRTFTHAALKTVIISIEAELMRTQTSSKQCPASS